MIIKQLSLMDEYQWAKKRMYQKPNPKLRKAGLEMAYALWEMAYDEGTRRDFVKSYTAIVLKRKDEEAEKRERKRDERAIQNVIDKLLKCKGEQAS